MIILLVLGHVAFAGDRFTLTLQAVALNASPLSIGILMSLLMVVPMLISIHNVFFYLEWMRTIRDAIAAGSLGSLQAPPEGKISEAG